MNLVSILENMCVAMFCDWLNFDKYFHLDHVICLWQFKVPVSLSNSRFWVLASSKVTLILSQGLYSTFIIMNTGQFYTLHVNYLKSLFPNYLNGFILSTISIWMEFIYHSRGFSLISCRISQIDLVLITALVKLPLWGLVSNFQYLRTKCT